jgi:hypothetical protein
MLTLGRTLTANINIKWVLINIIKFKWGLIIAQTWSSLIMDYFLIDDIHEIDLLYDTLEESFYKVTTKLPIKKTILEKTYEHRIAQTVKLLAKNLKFKQKPKPPAYILENLLNPKLLALDLQSSNDPACDGIEDCYYLQEIKDCCSLWDGIYLNIYRDPDNSLNVRDRSGHGLGQNDALELFKTYLNNNKYFGDKLKAIIQKIRHLSSRKSEENSDSDYYAKRIWAIN